MRAIWKAIEQMLLTMRVVLLTSLLLAIVGSPKTAGAQSGTRESDSLRTYRLSEIVVGAEVEEVPIMETVRRIPISEIVREDASSAADLARLLPSTHLQTNSRGESLIYVRNAGERQVAVFFDGALLNIPWDNRVDMSLIPVGMLGGMSVSQGVPSVVYGTNVLGGAVNLQTRTLSGPGSLVEAGVRLGTNNAKSVQATAVRKTDRYSVVAGGSLYRTDGQALPDGADLPFSQRGQSVRTNTDRRIGNAFVRLGHYFSSRTEVGLSLLHIESEKGVAPEGHIDPDLDNVRYWRYPEWRNTMLIANAITQFGGGHEIHASFWIGRFRQDIAQFESDAYARRTDLQEDQDLTLGMRLTGNARLGPGVVRGAVNWLGSTHRQRDIEDPDAGAALTEKSRYRQMLVSTGIEYESSLGGGFIGLVGVSLDGNLTPETGDKPDRDPEYAIGATAGIRKALNGRSNLRWSAGRKVRFPTMRELFGEALARFQLNPDLSPETSLQTELAYETEGSRASGEIVLFYRRTFDTIDQEFVEIDGVRKRRRVNLDGGRVLGLEIGGIVDVSDVVNLSGHASWMDPQVIEAGESMTQNEKPFFLSTMNVVVQLPWGATLQGAWIQTGPARALGLDNTQIRLAPAALFNIRAAFRKYFPSEGVFVELYAGAANLTDAVHYAQLGLPGPGRSFRAGTSITL